MKMVFCAWDGESVGQAVGLVDADGQPLRGNTVYCLRDGQLIWMQDLSAPALP